MRYLCRTLLPCCLCLLAGCVTTFSAEPLGEAIAVLKQDEWNGVWMNKSGKLARVLVVDAAQGRLLVVDDWKDCSAQRTESDGNTALQLRQSGSWYFPNPKEKEVLYEVWLAFRRDGELVYMCDVDEQRLRELVLNGVLPGFTYEGDVVVWPLSQDQYRVLLSDERPVFRCGAPAVEVFIRLPAELDPCRKTE